MSIFIKNRMIRKINLFKQYQEDIADFVSENIRFYCLFSQSYGRIVEKIEPILQNTNFLDDLKEAIKELQANPVWDEGYKEPFMFYDGLCVALWAILDETCEHQLEETEYGGTSCKLCKQSFGWHCPKSPDHQCHYHVFRYQGVTGILLADGQVFKMKKPRYESFDECMFCGQPQERK